MTQIRDFRDLGYFPMQDHDPDVPVGRRMAMIGVRVTKVEEPADAGDGNSSLIQYGREGGMGTIGDIHPWLFWQTHSRGRRASGAFAQAFAGIVTDRAAAGPVTGGGGLSGLSPIRDGQWHADLRFRGLPATMPSGLPTLPRGTIAFAMSAMDEKAQHPLILHADPRLVAPAAAGPGTAGTVVCDLGPENELCLEGSVIPGQWGRQARLQSLLRVIAFVPGGGGSDVPINGNALALNFGMSQQDGLAGYGMIFAPGIGGAVTGGGGPVTPGGGAGGGVVTPGSGADVDDPTPEGDWKGKAPHEHGTFRRSPHASHVVAFLEQTGGSGPIIGGAVHDKHNLGQDRDGHQMNPAHISSRALIFDNADRDGPYLFEGDYPHPPPLPLQAKVHLSWDAEETHTFVGGAAKGMWKWWAEVPIVQPGGGGGKPPNGPVTPPTGGRGGGRTGPPGPGGPGPGGPITPGGPPGRKGPGPGGPPAGGGPGPTTPQPTPAAPGGKPRVVTPRPPGYFDGPSYHRSRQPTPPAPRGPTTPRDPPGPTAPGPSWWPQPEVKSNAPVVRESRSPGVVYHVGEVQLSDRSLYVIHHPFAESFGSLSLRPQLWVKGAPNIERGGVDMDGEWLRDQEVVTPHALTARAWGSQSGTEFSFSELPTESRVRGGIVGGGVLWGRPEFEMEDYLGINADRNVWSPLATGHVALAPGNLLAFGVPHTDGGMAAASILMRQATSGNKVFTIEQLNSSRASLNLFRGEVSGTEVVVSVGSGGTQAVRIPRGTSAQRPSAIAPAGGELRISSNVVASVDTVEHYDAQTATWKQLMSSIANDQVTNAMLANMAAATIKGRASGAGTGDPTDLSALQVASIVSAYFAASYHEHPATEVGLDDSAWSGSLAGSGIRNVQELADWIDANLAP